MELLHTAYIYREHTQSHTHMQKLMLGGVWWLKRNLHQHALLIIVALYFNQISQRFKSGKHMCVLCKYLLYNEFHLAPSLCKYKMGRERLLSRRCLFFFSSLSSPSISSNQALSLSLCLSSLCNLHKKVSDYRLRVFFLFPQRLNVTQQIADLSEVLFVLKVCPHYKHLPDQSLMKGLTTSNAGPFPPHSARPANRHGNAVIT